ncbi:unnamed protein product [Urochloa humidicola]
MYIPILRPMLNKVGLVFPMPMVWHGFFCLGGGSSGRRRGWAEVASTSTAASPTSLVVPALGKGLGLECFLHGFQGEVHGGGGWCLMVLHGRAGHGAGALCGGIDSDEVCFFFFLCVGLLRFLCELPIAGCACTVYGVDGLATTNMSSGAWRTVLSLQGEVVHLSLVRLPPAGLLSQREKSGWFLGPTCSGGSAPLRGNSSSGELGFLAVASDSSVLGDVFWPGRSAFSKHIKGDVLLKTATKTYFPLPGRRSASSFELRLPMAMKTGRSLQGLGCIFLFFQESPCNIWVVTTKMFM